MNENEALTELHESEMFPVYCPICGTWIANLIPECLPGLMKCTCPNGHQTKFPKGIRVNGTTEVMAG